MVHETRVLKLQAIDAKQERERDIVLGLHQMLCQQQKNEPTAQEFLAFVGKVNSDLLSVAEEMVPSKDLVVYQSKSLTEIQLEKVIAFMALFAMVFDANRSDAIFKILGKVKTFFGTMDQEVRYQSLDEIESIGDEKRLTIDISLDTEAEPRAPAMDCRFSNWWHHQLEQNRTVPHYRTGGEFIEFTRQTAAIVSVDIATSTHKEFLIRGAVGSGKSTGLPTNLSRKGCVLLLEPTRPLAENVARQLRGEPFNLSPTLRMRGHSAFGSDKVTIMTSGFALHFMANNPAELRKYDFVIFDECHTIDAQAMGFYCLLKEFEFAGKILKVSATPPGRESEFKTQFPVNVVTEETIAFQTFADNQGTGSRLDATSCGDNILIYVASYNEVDQLSSLLLQRKFKVTKVDGRSMKVGSVEIPTYGTPQLKHFVVATNIIENGVTLDIDVVVDFGTKVVADLDVDARCMRYRKVAISYGERIQRLGRVGRVKPGTAIRIGHTEMGLQEIPAAVATEASFLCFAYGLPVMVHNVTTSMLSACTVQQARTMMNFELPSFFMVELVRYDGRMHPMIHDLLKVYKLRNSEICLDTKAIPSSGVVKWNSVKTYRQFGVQIQANDDVYLPFADRSVPHRVYENLWKLVCEHKQDAGFGRLNSVSACKVSYTLQTDKYSLPRTLAIIDQLIADEQEKQSYFSAINSSITRHSFSLAGIVDKVRKRWLRDHSGENIAILQRAKAQINEFSTLNGNIDDPSNLTEFGVLETVQYQSKDGVADKLRLKGRWDKKNIVNDLIVAGFVLAGSGWMAWSYLKTTWQEDVQYQGKKRQAQKLRFRDARDKKVGREVYGDDGTIEHYFGDAYTSRGRVKGSNVRKGMGIKKTKFTHMYGFDPTEYSFIRFVDPLTGKILDESISTDIGIVAHDFAEARNAMREEDFDFGQKIQAHKGIEAYFVNDRLGKALKVDLTPHVPLAMGNKSTSIAGFPEREGELRQTGAPMVIDISKVPSQVDDVRMEGLSINKGLFNYNPVAVRICQLINESDGRINSTYGIGYGSFIIANSHLFTRNNGTLTVKTHHGEFFIPNSTSIKVHHIKKKDMIVMRMPKDFPAFKRSLHFRSPTKMEKACLVGSTFQQKSIMSTISETTRVAPSENESYWQHWVSTKDGDCGLPLVSTHDGYIIGIHGLESTKTEKNYFIPFSDEFKDILDNPESLSWEAHWRHNDSLISWDGMKLAQDEPSGMFKLSKMIEDLWGHHEDVVKMQSADEKWVLASLNGNLKAVAHAKSQLVTKHVVKGRCEYFQAYLNENPDAHKFFRPLMGAYAPSRLNKEAFKKDFFKYNGAVTVGKVDTDLFDAAIGSVIELFEYLEFDVQNYVTDPDDIFDSLNMKAAVGALYTGKKKDYFLDYSDAMKECIIKESCERLYTGKMGVWNGSLKAELRPLEKVNENKTRTFTAAPIDTLLGGKVCVDDFNNRFYSLNMEGPWTVGMTKFYGGWDKLMNKLPNGWIYCDADGSRFDSSLTPYLINAVVTFREHFAEEWDIGKQMLRNFYTEIVYTPILMPDGTIVKKFKGNNSGQPSTVVDNTLMVIFSMHYAYKKYGWMDDFNEDKCVFFANGDDLIIAIHPDHVGLLDTLSASFLELGLNYDFSARHTEKTNLWFMSHQAMEREGKYIPKLEMERVVSILEWDRSVAIEHRAEAVCASMIEAWGHDELLHNIRLFYKWLMDRAEFKDLAACGHFPYIAETALRKLYLDTDPTNSELERYAECFEEESSDMSDGEDNVRYQSGAGRTELDAGVEEAKNKNKNKDIVAQPSGGTRDKDVDVGTQGQIVPRLNAISKMKLPKVKGKVILNLDHLLTYEPVQTDISNTRATQQQLEAWFNGVREAYEIDENQMTVLLNGFMVWCIENGTSPNISGVWTMMDGEEQVTYPLRPMIENAQPTLRQIMHHFSDAAEAYIEKRNAKSPYMPRYGQQRNLMDRGLARYAFDFYEVTSKTPPRAREAVMQMKAAALSNVTVKMFGLDGNVSTASENTERHTAADVSAGVHSLHGTRQML